MVFDGSSQNIFIVDISAGSRHSAIISSAGDLYTWGEGKHNCILQPGTEHLYYPTTVSPALLETRKVVRVACGESFTVVVTVPKKFFNDPKIRELYF